MQVSECVPHLREPTRNLLFFEFFVGTFGLVDVVGEITLRAPLHDQVQTARVVLESSLEAFDELDDARVVQRLEELAFPVRRIPVSLTKILRRYAFSHTQLRGRVVPYQVHGALRAPPNEADLGPARFWAGVHRRERCGPERDGGQLARRLVVRCARWANWPRRRCLLARARGGSRLHGYAVDVGSCSWLE